MFQLWSYPSVHQQSKGHGSVVVWFPVNKKETLAFYPRQCYFTFTLRFRLICRWACWKCERTHAERGAALPSGRCVSSDVELRPDEWQAGLWFAWWLKGVAGAGFSTQTRTDGECSTSAASTHFNEVCLIYCFIFWGSIWRPLSFLLFETEWKEQITAFPFNMETLLPGSNWSILPWCPSRYSSFSFFGAWGSLTQQPAHGGSVQVLNHLIYFCLLLSPLHAQLPHLSSARAMYS